MNAAVQATRQWWNSVADAWNHFWFDPAAPHTLAAIRILGGLMLFYTHLVWSFDLWAFLGPHGWQPLEAVTILNRSPFTWSYLWYVESPGALWTVHIAALIVFLLLTVGLWTRIVSVLAFIATLSYCHRLPGALYGLDQVNAMVAMYLILGPSGAVYSVDRWRMERWLRRATPPVTPSLGANIAIRLIQVHMCIVYLFGGITKLKGDMWWDGSAFWFAVANYEYQSIDATWMGHWPWAIALLTHVVIFWETFYPVLIWPRLTRPVMLGLAICVHGGIALFLGMKTFGLAMLIGNLAFVPPDTIRGLVARSRDASVR